MSLARPQDQPPGFGFDKLNHRDAAKPPQDYARGGCTVALLEFAGR
jgi:hypothetical protein